MFLVYKAYRRQATAAAVDQQGKSPLGFQVVPQANRCRVNPGSRRQTAPAIRQDLGLKARSKRPDRPPHAGT